MSLDEHGELMGEAALDDPASAGVDDDIRLGDLATLIHDAFRTFDPGYDASRDSLKARWSALSDRLDGFQRAGHTMTCSEQTRQEAKWLLNYRANWARLAERLTALEASLAELDQPPPVQATDGSWAGCTTEFYRKLEPTVDELQAPGLDLTEVRPLSFIGCFQDPAALRAYLWSLQISDIARTGRNDRDELGAVLTGLTQLVYKDELRVLLDDARLGFAVDTPLENALADFLAATQHPRTGYWGPWYRFGNRLLMVQDLSFTFHQVSYRRGDIANWPQLAKTTLRIKERRYPNGWRTKDGGLSNHNNYDVVQIFFYGWPHFDRPLKKRVADEIWLLVRWCLSESIDEGGFKGAEPFEELYFGVRFLDRVGFWDRAKRFWMPERLPDLGTRLDPVLICDVLDAQLGRLGNTSEAIAEILRAARCMSQGDLPEGGRSPWATSRAGESEGGIA